MLRVKVALMLASALLAVMPALAQDAPPAPELTGEVIVEGLNSPQGLSIDSEGNLLIADSGNGGDEEIETIDPTTFEPASASFGVTSRIIRRSADGTMEDLAALPSVAVGQDFLGAARVAELNGDIYVTVGAWLEAMGETADPELFGKVVRIEDGAGVAVADLWAYEVANNPDGTTNIESHPYSIVGGADGMLYVTDAAANALYRIDPASGDITQLAMFDALPGVFPSPFRNNELLTDPVPTAVVLNEDGSSYVSFLSGAPFVPGSAKVVSVAADGTVSDFATGLTMITDLKAGPDGSLYALQFGMFTEEGPVPNSGSVVRILPDGTSELVIEGLPFATALAVDADGNGYVAINGIAIPGAGMIVYYEGLTAMEGMPMPPMGG